MPASRSHVGVQPGDGLVARFGDSVLLVAGPTSEVDPFVEELVATVEAGAAEGGLPGAALAHRLWKRHQDIVVPQGTELSFVLNRAATARKITPPAESSK